MWPPQTGASAFVLQYCTGDPNVATKGADDQPGPWSDAAQEVVR